MERLNISRQPTGELTVTPANQQNEMLHVWERPLVGCRYLLSVRGGGKSRVVGGALVRERSVVLVLRRAYCEEPSGDMKLARLVARLAPPAVIDPTPLAEIATMLAQWYGDALCFVEVKDGPVLAREMQRRGASVMVREQFDKVSGVFTKEIGWLSDKEAGPLALNALVNAIRETANGGNAGVQIECEHALSELETFVDADSETPAVNFDDDVRALATGLYNIEAATLLRGPTRARRAPGDTWRTVETFR